MQKKQETKKIKSLQKKYLNNYIKYSSLAFEMVIIILAGTLGGKKLDEYTGLFPLFTVVLSLFAVLSAIYLAIKDFIKKN